MKYYEKVHYEEELDLFCRCIRAVVNPTLHMLHVSFVWQTRFKPVSLY